MNEENNLVTLKPFSMLDINKSPFIVGVLNPKYFDDELIYLKNNSPDIIEYRADLNDVINSDIIKSHFKKMSCELALPLLFTLRDKSEGGSFSGTGEQRNEIYSQALEFVDAIDIESSLAKPACGIIKSARLRNILVVLSYHNFDKTPEKFSLEKITDSCFELGADMAKIATMCDSKEEAQQLISLTLKYNNIAVVGMGKHGRITRITAPAFGSVFTYAFTDNKKSIIPGQLTVEELRMAWELAGIKVN